MAEKVLQNCLEKVVEQVYECTQKRSDGENTIFTCKICGNEDPMENEIVKHIKLKHHFAEIIHMRQMPKDNAIIELNWEEIEKDRGLDINKGHGEENAAAKASGKSVSLEQVHNCVGKLTDKESSEQFYFCEICKNQFIERNDVVAHVMTTHSYSEIEQHIKNGLIVTDIALKNRFLPLDNNKVSECESSDGSVKTFVCKVCEKGFNSLLNVKNHIASVHENKVIVTIPDDDTEIITRGEYELDDIKAMKKKLESCDRELGLKIDLNKGAKDGQCVYLNGDPATYEFMRGNVDTVIADVVGDLTFSEDKKNHKKFRVKTNSGPDAFVEERRIFYIERKKISATFYYTNSSIMFQGSNKLYPEFDNLTPAEWLSRKMEWKSKEIVKNHNMKQIVENMKRSIEAFEKREGSGGYGVRGKHSKGSNGPKKSAKNNLSEREKDIYCGKCKEICEKNGAAFEKCGECNNRQHLRCSQIKRGEYSHYRDGTKQIICFNCLIDPDKINRRLASITVDTLESPAVGGSIELSVNVDEHLLANDEDKEADNDMNEILVSADDIEVIKDKVKTWVNEAEAENETLKNKVKELQDALKSNQRNFENKMKVSELKIKVLHDNITSVQLEYNALRDKYDKDIEQKTVELSNVNHQYSLICHEKEDLRNQKDTLEKLVNRIENENTSNTNPAEIDSHIPVYKPSMSKVIEVNNDTDSEGEIYKEDHGLWTEVVTNSKLKDTKAPENLNKKEDDSNNRKISESFTKRRSDNDFDNRPRRRINNDNDFDNRTVREIRYCHFYNNSFRGCSNTSEECKFLHENAPACRSGENCRGIREFRRCGFYHESLSFLSQTSSVPRPPDRRPRSPGWWSYSEKRERDSNNSRYQNTDETTYSRTAQGGFRRMADTRY
jgi:hypothetical protein